MIHYLVNHHHLVFALIHSFAHLFICLVIHSFIQLVIQLWLICITVLPGESVHWFLITHEYLSKSCINVLSQLIQYRQFLPVTKNDSLLWGCRSQLKKEIKETMLLTVMEVSERLTRVLSPVVWPLVKKLITAKVSSTESDIR
jgi:hypothetical protein